MENSARKPNKGLLGLVAVVVLVICGIFFFSMRGNVTASISEKQIIRLAHNQSSDHPTHTGMLAFEEFIEEKYGTSTMSKFIQVSYWVPKPTWYNLHKLGRLRLLSPVTPF